MLCIYTYIVDFDYTHIYVLFIILFSTFRACMDHYFVLWRHTQFLFNGFSSVFLCACICCSVTVLRKWVAPPKMVCNWYRV